MGPKKMKSWGRMFLSREQNMYYVSLFSYPLWATLGLKGRVMEEFTPCPTFLLIPEGGVEKGIVQQSETDKSGFSVYLNLNIVALGCPAFQY